MLYRIKQFVAGLTAHGPVADEKKMIADILPTEARKLFYGMNTADQRHSLCVMYTAEKLWQECHGCSDDFALLQRCCLLHDVGRGKKMGPIRKSWAVILNKLHPVWARRHGRCDSQSYVRSLLYRYYHHGKISGEMLSAIGMAQEAAIVAKHHKKSASGLTASELEIWKILRQADSLN